MPALPSQMTYIKIRAPGGPDMLVPKQSPLPQPGAGEVLVKVAAAGVNRPDVMQRQGLYPPPTGATDIPGLEIAGEVVALGAGVTRWKLGDQVMALVVAGLLNKQVGGELGISEITVKAHRGQVVRKMKARSLVDLVMMAARLGIPPAARR